MKTTRRTGAAALVVLALSVSTPAYADNGSIIDVIKSKLSGLFASEDTKRNTVSAEGYNGPKQMDATRASIAYSSDYSSNASRIEATNKQNCVEINKTASEWKKESVQRSEAPSPVNVIRDSSCFPDVQGIKIPRTGFDFLDSLMPQLLKLASSTQCNATSGFWDNIVSKAKKGEFNGLMGSSINAGTKYISQKIDSIVSQSYSGPKTDTSYNPTAGSAMSPQQEVSSVGVSNPPAISQNLDDDKKSIEYVP